MHNKYVPKIINILISGHIHVLLEYSPIMTSGYLRNRNAVSKRK